MQVWAGGIAGAPNGAQLIARLNGVTDVDGERGLVSVVGDRVTALDADQVAVTVAGISGLFDGTAGDRVDRCPRRGGEVDALVELVSVAGRAVAVAVVR